MIYRRATVWACARFAAGIAPVVTGISALVFFSRLLGDAAAGAIPPFILGWLFVLTLLKYVPQLLMLTAFAGVFVAMRRAYALREMEAWFSAGLGARAFVRPVLMFALPAAVCVGMFSLVAAPWAVYQINSVRLAAAFEVSPEALPRDRFAVTPGGGYSYFFSSDNAIFLANNRRDEVVFANGVAGEGGAALRLIDGRLHALSRVDGEEVLDTMRFGSIRLALPAAAAARAPPRAKPTAALRLEVGRERGEFFWRWMLPMGVFFLTLFALALAPVHSAAGRRFGFLAAIAVFFLYLSSMRLARDVIAADVLPAALAVGLPSAAMSGVVVGLMWLFARR